MNKSKLQSELQADSGSGRAQGITNHTAADKRFRVTAASTVAIIYLLILVGGIVRASGSGMGCPDWPTCFGQWIPPLSAAELPDNYQQIYADRGYAETTFNVRKTWTEYLNRLLGVLTGFFILMTLLASLSQRARDATIFHVSLGAFLLVVFQGWLGSRVVASNLAPGMITVHMLVAQVIVGLLIYTYVRSQKPQWLAHHSGKMSRLCWWLLLGALVASLVQIVVGTQVREAVDLIAKQSNNENRHLWIDNLPVIFSFHRLFAYPTVLINLLLVVLIFRDSRLPAACRLFAGILLGLVTATMVMGLSLDRMHVPAFAQPLHLWFASMILGTQFYLLVANSFMPTATRTSKGGIDHPAPALTR